MSSIILTCDFSKQFSDKFHDALNRAATSGSQLNVVHVINLPIAVEEQALTVFSREWLILKSLRDQAEREFSILNKRLNPTGVAVTFEVGFGVAHDHKKSSTLVL